MPNPPSNFSPAERDALIAKWTPYVPRIVGSLRPYAAGFEVDDWISIGYVALIAALDSYDRAKHDVSLDTYLRNRIAWDILHEAQLQRAGKRDISLSLDDVPGWEESLVPFHDVHTDPELRDAMERLTPFQHAIVHEYYWVGRTDREIAELAGTSWHMVQRHKQAALTSLRATFGVVLPPKGTRKKILMRNG